MSLRKVGAPRRIGNALVQYVAETGHTHEGGHRIDVDGRNLLVRPDGRTTARNRSHVITRVLHALSDGDTLPLETLVGALVLEGATSLEVDGRPILNPEETTVATLRLEVVAFGPHEGEIRVTSIGGAG